MAKSVQYTLRGLTVESREGISPFVREFYVWRWQDGGAAVDGYLEVAWDEDCATAGNLEVARGARFGSAHALLWVAARHLARHNVPGVIIKVSGENRARKMYKRMGFEQTNIPGIMTATTDTIRLHLIRWRFAHAVTAEKAEVMLSAG